MGIAASSSQDAVEQSRRRVLHRGPSGGELRFDIRYGSSVQHMCRCDGSLSEDRPQSLSILSGGLPAARPLPLLRGDVPQCGRRHTTRQMSVMVQPPATLVDHMNGESPSVVRDVAMARPRGVLRQPCLALPAHPPSNDVIRVTSFRQRR